MLPITLMIPIATTVTSRPYLTTSQRGTPGDDDDLEGGP